MLDRHTYKFCFHAGTASTHTPAYVHTNVCKYIVARCRRAVRKPHTILVFYTYTQCIWSLLTFSLFCAKWNTDNVRLTENPLKRMLVQASQHYQSRPIRNSNISFSLPLTWIMSPYCYILSFSMSKNFRKERNRQLNIFWYQFDIIHGKNEMCLKNTNLPCAYQIDDGQTDMTSDPDQEYRLTYFPTNLIYPFSLRLTVIKKCQV